MYNISDVRLFAKSFRLQGGCRLDFVQPSNNTHHACIVCGLEMSVAAAVDGLEDLGGRAALLRY